MIQTYHKPENLETALALKTNNPDALYLAGGTQVNRAPLDQKSPMALIDLHNVISAKILFKDGEIFIGAMATLQDIADSTIIPDALKHAAGFIPSRSIRNQATIGGNIAAKRSDSYIIPTLFALNAKVCTSLETLSVEKYIGENRDELILSFCISSSEECIAVKESRSFMSLPVVGAAVSLGRDSQNKIVRACVAVSCVADCTIRLSGVEERLIKGELTRREDLEDAISAAVNSSSDILGSRTFKKYINGVVIASAIKRCLEVSP